MSTSMQTIGALEEQIRSIVTDRGRAHFAQRDWYSVCAALDNLGDTVLALQSYQRAGFGRTMGTQYLRAFGFLQAVYLQQDSITTLCRTLNGFWQKQPADSAWVRLRELRNRIGGHPAQRGAFLARISIGNRSQRLKVMWWDDEKAGARFEDVDLPSWFADYKREAAEVLNEIIRQQRGGRRQAGS